MLKTCEKRFYKNNRVLLRKKSARKNTKYSRNETILKIGHLARAIAHPKATGFAKWSVWVKNSKCQKHAKNDSPRTLQLPMQRLQPLNNGHFGSKIQNAKNVRKMILQEH